MKKKVTKKQVVYKDLGTLSPTSIRLTGQQKNRIYKRFDSIQAFVDKSYKHEFSRRKTS
tara:strand:+ start:3791 stop:3967 length:177 start_codon:yes stop_codon:yes gene_type:complete